MKYIFDTNTLTVIFGYYYFGIFPSFWIKFNELKDKRDLISVREVRREIEEKPPGDKLEEWISKNTDFFENPTVAELNFIKKIYSISHFQQNMGKRKQLKGGAFADPFIIAKAKINNAIVVTLEKYKENAAKIPNICKRFNVECINLEEFLNKENWKF
ncbi:MAG: PIN domain-containing protein [Promethearchaeota archaeon]